MKPHQLQDEIGKALFIKQFPEAGKYVLESGDEYSKYDLLYKNKKYIEIKCNSTITAHDNNMITYADFEFLTTKIPTDSTSIYVLFDDEWCLVYDLTSIYEFGFYFEKFQKIYADEMNQKDLQNRRMIHLDFKKCTENKLIKFYPKTGSLGLMGFKISDVIRRNQNGTADETFINEILTKIGYKK